MKAEGYNPPTTKCKDADAGCTGPSKSFFVGSKSYFKEDGSRDSIVERWKCEHGHGWLNGITEEPKEEP